MKNYCYYAGLTFARRKFNTYLFLLTKLFYKNFIAPLSYR